MEKRPDQELEQRRRRGRRRHHDPDDFFGLDVEKMSPRAQVATSLAVIVPVVLAGIGLFAFTHVWWIWFIFFWVYSPPLASW